jgi:Xaa-Pro dipeptidase
MNERTGDSGAYANVHAPTGPDLWFPRAAYERRVGEVQRRLTELDADVFIAILPESVTYLTGFYTRGYAAFQIAVVPRAGEPVTVFRDVELYHFEKTSAFAGRRTWKDGEDPIDPAARVIRELAGSGQRLAFEANAWPLNLALARRMMTALPQAAWIDASSLVADMRLIKSPAEISYQRRAGRAAEAGMSAALARAAPGISERELAAAVCAAMIEAGSDVAGPGVLASGEAACHLHGSYGDRRLDRGDTVQLEVTPAVRHYHARFMRPIKLVSATDAERHAAEQLVAIQDAALAEVAPGRSVAGADQVYREGVREAGLAATYTNKTFYSIGLMFPPRSAEPLEAAPGSTWRFEAGMVFHTYVIAGDLGISETIAVSEKGYERLTTFDRELLLA